MCFLAWAQAPSMCRDKGSRTHSPGIRLALALLLALEIPLAATVRAIPTSEETAISSAETQQVMPIRPVSSTLLPEAMQECSIPQAPIIPLAAIKRATLTPEETATPSVASLPATPITAGVAIPLVGLVQATITQQAFIILLLEPWLAFPTRLEITISSLETRLV